MLSIQSGHSASYLTDQVATGRENYYTGAVAAGEPPGRWQGRGAAFLGLSGEVDAQDMKALYERFLDPRDPGFHDPNQWDEVATLGHAGRAYLTEDQIHAAALEREPGADPERRAVLRVEAGMKARKNVAFHDATFSVQKSITVLHTAFEAQAVQAQHGLDAALAALAGAEQRAAAGAAGASGAAVHRAEAAVHRARLEVESWSDYRQAVEDAIWSGNNAGLAYLSGKAGYTRIGHHGGHAGRWADAHDWVVASFFQHDSRDHDPQLHIHNAILNRVQGPDGEWRTLDSRAIRKYRGAAGAIAERAMEQHLTQALGVRFATRPDGKAREIVGIDQPVMDLFSSRRHAITKRTAELVSEFEHRFGREPNGLERTRLAQQATLATRRTKSHDGEPVAERLGRWDAELRAEVAGGLAQVADQALAARSADAPVAGEWTETAVLQTALARVHESRAVWTASDLTRAISDSLPDQLGSLAPDEIAELLQRLTDDGLQLATPLEAARPGEAVLPEELRLANGSSAYEAPGGRTYASPEHLDTERLLQAGGGQVADRRALTIEQAGTVFDTLAEQGTELGADQAAAIIGILTSGARIETLVGPAGTGKSFLLGTLAHAWEDPQLWDGQARRVVGLSTAEIAADVLAAEGLTARNVSQWLATQDRIAAGTASPQDRAWALADNDLVVVDEAGMADTAALARIHAYAEQARAKLLLVGDHRQLSAVGAAGGMDLAATSGPRYELTETRRFTNDWEGPASLRLREHDQSVVGDYHQQGRLIDGGAAEQTEHGAARAWLADTLEGRRSLLIVDSNEQAARMSADVRARLVDLGLVDDDRTVALGLQGLSAGRGDLVQARENAWHLARYAGNRRPPRNRDEFKITDIGEDGSITVAPIDRSTGRTVGSDDGGETMRLPADYVADKLVLGYAYTVHAAQGVTVDTTHTVITPRTGADALYVGMSRGREANTAHVVTLDRPEQAEVGETLEAVHRNPQAVLATVLESDEPELSALAHAADAADEAEAIRTPGELFADAADIAAAGRTAKWLDQAVQDGILTDQQRVAIATEEGGENLSRLLRQVEIAGHDPHAALTEAISRRDLDDARQISSVLHHRICDHTNLEPTGDSYREWTPALDNPQWAAYLDQLAAAADKRQAELGQEAADRQPQWAVEALGPVPDTDDDRRKDWVGRAGVVAAHRELTRYDDESEPLGPAPKPGQVEAYASWHAAWQSLGRPTADRAEAEMSTGQLRVRIAAYEREKTWAPDYVADRLAATRQTVDARRNDSTLLTAKAEATRDPDQRDELLEQAGDAAALAETLQARAAELTNADATRGQWYAHTAETRAAAERAAVELSTRDDAAFEEQPVTAAEWLAARRASDEVEDQYRAIGDDHELTHVEQQRDDDLAASRREPTGEEPVAEPVPDIRADTDVHEPSTDDSMRVPTADETEAAVRRAQRALVELRQRQADDEQHLADEQSEQDEDLARWHHDEHTDAQDHQQQRPDNRRGDHADHAHGPALELSPIK